MADYSNIPTGLKITSQIPLNVKEYVKDEATLAYLGVDDNLAYTYHDQLEILCLEEKTIYKWREVESGEENTGLIPLDFTYPSGLPLTFGIDYSNKVYNFFKVDYITLDNINTAINIINLGSGVKPYKGYNASNDSHEFRTITKEDLGMGMSFLKDIQENENELNVRVKTLISDNLTITSTEDEIRIETPSTASIPALYVNNLYIPTEAEFLAGNTKGEGTLAKPFTDTVTAYVAGVPTITSDTAIQNALDAYVGDTGTYSRLNPQLSGQQIIVQDNNTGYIFSGDFGYSKLNIKISGNVTSTNSGYLIDMDNPLHFNSTQDAIKVTVDEDYILSIQGEGLKNNGTTTATNNLYLIRQCILQGDGLIDFIGSDISKYLLTSDKDSIGNGTTGFNNDGSWQFEVRCYLRSEYQGLVAIGGKGNILNLGATYQTGSVSSDVDINLKAFYQKGGGLSLRNNSSIIMYGSNTTTRLKGFIFEPTNGFSISFDQDNCSMIGNVDTLYSKDNTGTVSLIVSESGSGLNMSANEIFYSFSLWSVIFRNNIFAAGNIDSTMVDLTQGNSLSVTNTIGANVVESLRYYNSKASAKSAGLPTNSIFLKRVTVSAGNFEIGTEYRILTSGTPSIGTVGDYFTAVDNGSTYVGATAYLETREILI